MQASARQQELERLYNARKGHVPQISISDDSHHITEAIGSYYETDEGGAGLASPVTPNSPLRESRPLSFVPGARETYDTRSRRQGTYLEGPPSGLRIDTSNVSSRRASPPAASRRSPRSPQRSDQQPISPPSADTISPHHRQPPTSPKVPLSPKQKLNRAATVGTDSAHYASSSPAQPPPLNRSSSAETAVQQFPLNDIDYETSPAAVAQELSNLQAIRRMSMNVDTADPDLPLFAGSFSSIPSSPSRNSDDDNDPSKLFWVPASLHPELAPKEFKTFIEDRVEKIRRRSGGGGEDGLLSDGLERSGSDSSLRRKKSMLSHQIDARGHYEDGADRLSRKRSKGMQVEAQTTVGNLSELESLVNDPTQLLRRMSLDTSRRSLDSGVDVPKSGDVILPGAGSLKRSTRTTYRKQSLKNGERFPKRGQHRHTGSDVEESPISPTGTLSEEPEPIMGILRVQTDPGSRTEEYHANFSRPSQRYRNAAPPTTAPPPPAPQTQEEYSLQDTQWDDQDGDACTDSHEHEVETPSTQPPPQPRQFQSRIASQGRTTAQLPGYTNTNPLPNVIDTLPDGSKVPSQGLIQQLPPRKSSHEIPRQFQRGLPARSSSARQQPPPTTGPTFDDIPQTSSIPPGNTSTRTDALAIVPTLTEEKKVEKKEPTKKSGWKWILGNDDDKSKDDKSSDSKSKSSKKSGADKARLDVLQNSIDGTTPASGRESLVLSRDDIIIEEPPRNSKASKKSESRRDQPGLLSALFGGKKKSFDSDHKEKKRKGDRNLLSPDHVYRPLKPDIDYNWTRFSILEERAIYRMAHLKLANPRRALHSQVLLSNFMYSYLAKVQLMHPQIQIPPAQQRAQQRGQPKSSGDDQQQQQQQQSQQSQQQQKPAEYSQYQQWQEQQSRQEAVAATPVDQEAAASTPGRTSAEHHHHESDIFSDEDDHDGRVSGDYDARRSSEDDYRPQSSSASGGYGHYQPQQQSQQHYRPSTSSSYSSSARGAPAPAENKNAGLGGGYSVSSTHDYLGYRHDEQPFGKSSGHDGGLWDDDEDEKEGEMW